jgi:hypothetical protein
MTYPARDPTGAGIDREGHATGRRQHGVWSGLERTEGVV